jgi:hypothetical protein
MGCPNDFFFQIRIIVVIDEKKNLFYIYIYIYKKDWSRHLVSWSLETLTGFRV